MLVISTLGSLVISWRSCSLVRAWLSDKPPVTTLVSIPGWWPVPGLTWLHYRPSISQPDTSNTSKLLLGHSCSCIPAAAQLELWTKVLPHNKETIGRSWVMAGPGSEVIPSHWAGCSDYRCTVLGVGYVGGSSVQPSPAQVCWMQWAVIPWQIPSAPRCWGRQRGHWTPDPGLELDFLIQKIFKPNKYIAGNIHCWLLLQTACLQQMQQNTFDSS